MHRVGRVLSFFSSRRNWDSPTPSAAGECAPPLWSGGRGTFAGEWGGGRVPILTRGHTLWYSIYISTLWLGPLSGGGRQPHAFSGWFFKKEICSNLNFFVSIKSHSKNVNHATRGMASCIHCYFISSNIVIYRQKGDFRVRWHPCSDEPRQCFCALGENGVVHFQKYFFRIKNL
jgi:hypothetical protein